MQWFVNMPASWIYQDKNWLDLFIKRKLYPEIGLDLQSIAFPAVWHRDLAQSLKDNGLACSVHLPFAGLPVGAPAKYQADALDTLLKATDIATIYDAKHLIGHPSFNAELDSCALQDTSGSLSSCPACTPPYENIPAEPLPSMTWLQNSQKKWQRVLDHAGHIPLNLENTHDTSPLPIMALLELLPEQAGFCFDIGHWFSFGGGSRRENLSYWVEQIHTRLKHLHIHDNKGLSDQHIGLGSGKIPLESFFTLLEQSSLFPSYTLEPHDLASLQTSLDWLSNNQTARKWAKDSEQKQH